MNAKSINKNLNISAGDLLNYTITNKGLRLKADNCWMQIDIYEASCICITAGLPHQSIEQHYSYAVISQPGKADFDIGETDKTLEVRTEKIHLVITKYPLRFTFYNAAGQLVNEDDKAFGISWIGDEPTLYKKLHQGERFIGLGEKTGNLDRRGNAFILYNNDYFAYPVNGDPLYCSIPFYIGIHKKHAYGIFLDNSFTGVFNFGASNDRFASITAAGGLMRYFFIHDNDIASIISAYCRLTGMPHLPPRWSLGFHQCRYSYYPDKEVLRIAHTFREKQIPADVLYLDIHYMDGYKVFTFDRQRFPHPAKLAAMLKRLGFRLTVILDPGIKIDPEYPPYQEGIKHGYFLKYPDGSPYSAQVWPGWCHFPDFTRPETRSWWANQCKFYTQKGIEGFWNDMNEPASWGQRTPDLVEFHYEGYRTTHKEGRNVYGMQMARSTAEGARKHLGNNRPFILTRAGYAGIQRYAAVWTGDNVATEEHMLAGVRLVNSLGLSGVPFAGYDAGGFAGEPSPQLFARWISIAAFSPFFRAHSMINTRDSEPWAFGESTEDIARNYITLRYRLLPYIYSLFHHAASSGMPVARSLAIDYPFENNTFDERFQNQYLFGDYILIAPLESTHHIAHIWLPGKGEWYDLFTGERLQGNKTHYVESPVEKLPVFVKGGGMLLMQSPVQSTMELQDGILHLHIFPDNASEQSFLWYDDDGTTFEYEKGNYCCRHFHLNSLQKRLTITPPTGNYTSPFTRIRIWFHGRAKRAETATVNGTMKTLRADEVRFLEPVSNFDPLGKPATLYTHGMVPYLQIPLKNGEIVVEW